jgi:hypothetical protein
MHRDYNQKAFGAVTAKPAQELRLEDFTRRRFLSCVGGTMALGGLGLLAEFPASAASARRVASTLLPPGAALRVQPVLVYELPVRRERTSWRGYGGLQSQVDVDQELKRLEDDFKQLPARAEFPLELLPLRAISNPAELQAACASACDAFLVCAASGPQQWMETLLATKKPNLVFVRHKSGPVYLYYEIAHWRLLRKSGDTKAEPNLDYDDVVVDDFGDVLWRLRALYGLKNARGTKVLALGGMAAYSAPAQELGPAHAQQRWGYEFVTVSHEQIAERVQQARNDPAVMREAERQTAQLLAQRNVTLATDRRFVVNTYVALKIIQDLMRETGATNVGVAHCMGGLIPILDTPPCLVLSILNDEGFTAFCHTDVSHTLPGVLLRWISRKPSFVCNSHFPHHGVVTLAHCAAPRKMNGRDYEPTKIMTHYESDYGAATKVQYRKGQAITCLIPNLHCTKWFGFRGQIVDSPTFEACRSQMDIRIDGDWRKLTREMEGFHTVVCYGDYLREIGYALQKVGGIEWRNYSEPA